MKQYFIIIAIGLTLVVAAKAEISKQDIERTLFHIETLAQEQKVDLLKAQSNLKALQGQYQELQKKNDALERKGREALEKFLMLYAIIAGLVAWIFRGPLISAAKGLIFFAK